MPIVMWKACETKDMCWCKIVSRSERKRIHPVAFSDFIGQVVIPSLVVAGPHTWNNLLDAIRDSDLTFLTFKKLLKSHLCVWLPRRLWLWT